MDLQYNEKDGTWGPKTEPFCTIEFAERDDLIRLINVYEFWNEHHADENVDVSALRAFLGDEAEATT